MGVYKYCSIWGFAFGGAIVRIMYIRSTVRGYCSSRDSCRDDGIAAMMLLINFSCAWHSSLPARALKTGMPKVLKLPNGAGRQRLIQEPRMTQYSFPETGRLFRT